MGITAAALVVAARRTNDARGLGLAAIVVLVAQIALDLFFARSPKPGHIAGFLTGLVLSAWLVPRRPRESRSPSSRR